MMATKAKEKQPDPDIPLVQIADVRWRLANNYVIYQPQIKELMESFDRLQDRHRADLRRIKKLEEELEACGRNSTTTSGPAPI